MFSALLHLLLLITRSGLSSSTIAGAIFVRLNKILIRVRTSFLIRSVNSNILKPVQERIQSGFKGQTIEHSLSSFAPVAKSPATNI